MAKTALIVGLLLGSLAIAHGQERRVPDKLVLKNGEVIKCRVLKVDAANVEIDPEGPRPFDIISRDKISSIEYSDGGMVNLDAPTSLSTATRFESANPLRRVNELSEADGSPLSNMTLIRPGWWLGRVNQVCELKSDLQINTVYYEAEDGKKEVGFLSQLQMETHVESYGVGLLIISVGKNHYVMSQIKLCVKITENGDVAQVKQLSCPQLDPEVGDMATAQFESFTYRGYVFEPTLKLLSYSNNIGFIDVGSYSNLQLEVTCTIRKSY